MKHRLDCSCTVHCNHPQHCKNSLFLAKTSLRERYRCCMHKSLGSFLSSSNLTYIQTTFFSLVKIFFYEKCTN